MDFARVAALLGRQAPKLILWELAARKRAKFEELAALHKDQVPTSSDEDTLNCLHDLERHSLIKLQEAVLPKWNEYYVTTEGLEATRTLLSK
jgi:hypothetical protein